MLRTVLAGKIHRATVTGACLEYVGSISIDSTLLQAAGMFAYEQVHVVNVNNGARLVTYALEATADSGTVVLNGAAARLAVPGDLVIVLVYAQATSQDLRSFSPLVVHVDAQNRIIQADAKSSSPSESR